MKEFRTNLMSVVICIALVLGIQVPVDAAMVSTPDLLPTHHSTQDLSQARKDLEQQLVDLGVMRQHAKARVAQLTDDQISQISHKLSNLPAGAGAGSILLTLFIVFVITDVIGATDIFTFIHPIR